MANRRVFYTGLVILLTVITVGAIISMKIVESNSDVYDKLDTNIRCGEMINKQESRGNPLLFEYWNKIVC